MKWTDPLALKPVLLEPLEPALTIGVVTEPARFAPWNPAIPDDRPRRPPGRPPSERVRARLRAANPNDPRLFETVDARFEEACEAQMNFCATEHADGSRCRRPPSVIYMDEGVAGWAFCCAACHDTQGSTHSDECDGRAADAAAEAAAPSAERARMNALLASGQQR